MTLTKRLKLWVAHAARWLLRGIAAVVPMTLVCRISTLLIGDREIALCFHRVGPPDLAAKTLMPELCHEAADIDAILDALGRIEGELTIAFDDGYADAAAYVLDRAPKHPGITWRYMVCPQKTIERRAFPWDDWIADQRSGDVDEFLAEWRDAHDRDDASAVGTLNGAERELFALATVQQCKALAALDNVELGNHTDRHLPSSWLSSEELVEEIQASEQRFADEFGSAPDFAFPFGTHPYVSAEDVRVALDTVDGNVWTIGSRAVVVDRRVRPRFSMRSTDGPPKAVVFTIAVRCYLARQRERRAVSSSG